MKKIIQNFTILLIFFCSFIHKGFGQNVEISFNTTEIKKSEIFIIRILIPAQKNKELHNVIFPEIPDFYKRNTSFTKDDKQGQIIVTQEYVPLKEGTFQVPPFYVNVYNEKVFSNGTKLKVTSLEKQASIEINKDEFTSGVPEGMLQYFVSKNQIWSGEGVRVSLGFCIKQDNKAEFNFYDLEAQVLTIHNALQFPYALQKRILEPGALKIDSVKIKNKNYLRYLISDLYLFPIDTNDIVLPVCSLKILTYLTKRKTASIERITETTAFKTELLTVKVKSLPSYVQREAVPVGRFHLDEKISSYKSITGKTFSYIFAVNGKGNPETILPFIPKSNEIFEFYSPTVHTEILNPETSEFRKSFHYYIQTKEPGNYYLSEYFKLIYFDVERGKYDTLSSRFAVKVEGESQKNNYISASDEESFYQIIEKGSDKIRDREKDASTKFFANVLILFMLVTTIIIILKR